MVHILKSNCVKEWKSYFIGETVFGQAEGGVRIYVHNGIGHKKEPYSHLKDSQTVGEGKDFTAAKKYLKKI